MTPVLCVLIGALAHAVEHAAIRAAHRLNEKGQLYRAVAVHLWSLSAYVAAYFAARTLIAGAAS